MNGCASTIPLHEAPATGSLLGRAGPMPTHEGLGADDRDGLEDRRKPSIQLDRAFDSQVACADNSSAL